MAATWDLWVCAHCWYLCGDRAPASGCKGWRGGRPLAARVPACVSAWGWEPWHPAVVQSLSHVQLFVTSWTAAHQASLSSTISWSLPKLMSIESVRQSPTISSSVTPFSSCPQSFPASGSFPVSWLFTSGGQRTGASASASVLPMSIQD